MSRGIMPPGKTTSPVATGEDGASSALVPSRRQYLDLKRQHPHAILLYRLGDFYESFDGDAEVVARDARIVLTSRSFGRSGRVPMAGIPHHALNHYLTRLLAAGHTIAIAEQVSEPGRGLVERAVTRVLSPGTVGDASLLPAGESRYLSAISARADRYGLAWMDVSTGEFRVMEFVGDDRGDRLVDELTRLQPVECLLADGHELGFDPAPHITRIEGQIFHPERAQSLLCHHFGTATLAPFGCAETPAATGAAGAVLTYVSRTNPALLGVVTGLRSETTCGSLALDGATRRNLELDRSFQTGGARGSLLGILDRTETAMGARALRRLLGQPLRDLDRLRERQALVAAFVTNAGLRGELRRALARVGDLERLTARIVQGGGSIRDLLTLSAALRTVVMVPTMFQATRIPALAALAGFIDPCADILRMLDDAVEDSEDGGGRIRPGFEPELDRKRERSAATRRWLLDLERAERVRTGIRSLKVGYNKVFGYYIEVTRPNLGLVPSEYVRKQTVATGERFITAELKDAEARILADDEEIAALERAAIARLSAEVARFATNLLATAGQLAFLDATISLGDVADRYEWIAPELDESERLVIVGGRHPVVEATLDDGTFIANDCRLGGEDARVQIVTGPNMGGKSTYLRQTALIVLLAQIGSFVPASAAHIGLVDRIFTRVGAHDDLARGSSTFMVEMVETAAILHQATSRSLIILDEVGRGTSTRDGLAIAQAVLEDVLTRIRARTLFATHYLELTTLAPTVRDVANVHVAALEAGDRVILLYAVRPGAANQAYGIQVARLAGLPPWVADRARDLLAGDSAPLAPTAAEAEPAGLERFDDAPPEDVFAYQLRFHGFHTSSNASEELARRLLDLDLPDMSPREAMDWLFEQQSRLRHPR